MARSCGSARMWLLLLILAATGVAAGGQSAAPAPAPTPARRADTVADAAAVPPTRFDVMVTDKRGRFILDLKPSDFELRDNGVTQKLATAELRDTRDLSPEALPADATPDDEERLAGEPGTRVFAFVLDEFHVPPGETSDRARAAVTQFINDRLRPDDLALVLKPLDSLTGLRFTRHREPLRTAVAGFGGRKGDDSARTPFEQQFIGTAPEAVHLARAQIVTAALRELAVRLSELGPERAAIAYVGEGFVRPAAGTRMARVPDLQGILRACSRFNIPIYVFNPAPAPEADTDAGRAAAALTALSTQTGGEMVTGLDAFEAGLRRMDDDLTVYYALTFQPSTTDGRFHQVEVRTKRPNAVVRTRPGYWAPLPPSARLATAPLPPLSRRELKHSALITAWTGITRDPSGQLRLVVTWEPRPPNKAAVVRVTARTAEGAPLYESTIGQPGERTAGTSGDSARFDVPPGRMELDLSVLSMSGTVLDVDKRDLDVPDLSSRGGPVLFTPELVRARTLPEFRTISGDQLAAPSPARAFRRGDRLLVRASAWDPASPSVEIGAQLLNRANRPMRAIERVTNTTGPMTTFDLPLAWLAPGEYAIEIKARSENGETREVIRFTVR